MSPLLIFWIASGRVESEEKGELTNTNQKVASGPVLAVETSVLLLHLQTNDFKNPHNLFEVSSCVFRIRLTISVATKKKRKKASDVSSLLPPPVIVTYFNFPAGLRGG